MREDMTRELDGLIQGYLDETLTDEEARRLGELLKEDDRNLDEFIRAADLHGVLAGLRSERAPKSVAGDAFEERLRARLRVPTAPRSKLWRLLKVACGLVVAVGLVVLGNAFSQGAGAAPLISQLDQSAEAFQTDFGVDIINKANAPLEDTHLAIHGKPSPWKWWGIDSTEADKGRDMDQYMVNALVRTNREQRTKADELVGAERDAASAVTAKVKEVEKLVEANRAPEAKVAPPAPVEPMSPTAGIVKPPPWIPSADKSPAVSTLAAAYDSPVEIFEPRPAQENRKVVRNAEASIEVDSYEAAYAKLIEMVAREKGYVSDGDIQKMPNGKIQANVTVRIPAERFDGVLGRLKEFGTVKYQNIKSEDVTKAYFDHQARLKSKELLLERLKTVLKDAKGTAKELMEVEVQIGSTLESIDTIKGELRYYDAVVSMSTLILGLVEKDLTQPFEYVQTLQSNIGLTARDADDAYAKAQKEIADAGGQVVDSKMNRQNDGSATGTIRARVDAEKFPALREALKKLGHVTNDTVNQQKTARGGQEGAAKPDAPLKKEQAVVDLSIATPPIVVTRHAALLVEYLKVQEAYPDARKTIEAAGGKVVNGSLMGRDTSASATLVAQIDAERFNALVETLKNTGKLKDSRVRLDLPAATPDGTPALLRERAEIELVLVPPPQLIDDEHGIGKTVRDTFAGSWKGVLWSVEKLFVGLSLAGPWLVLALIGWLGWRRWRKKKAATT